MISLFNEVLKSKNRNALDLLQKIKKSINQKSAPAILSFIHTLHSTELYLEQDLRQDFEINVQEIQTILTQFLSDKLAKLVTNEPLNFKVIQKEEKTNVFDQSIKLIFETLIRKTQHEIQNNINILFKKETLKNINITVESLNYLNLVKHEERIFLIKEIASFVQEQDLQDVLDYFDKNPEFFDIFIITMKFINPEILQCIYNMIYTSKKYLKKSLVCSLVNIEIDKILPNIREYNWEILAGSIEKSPEIIPDICTAYSENILNLSKNTFTEKILDQDGLFCHYIDYLPFTHKEFLELCSSSKPFTNFYYEKIKAEDEMLDFAKHLQRKSKTLQLSL